MFLGRNIIKILKGSLSKFINPIGILIRLLVDDLVDSGVTLQESVIWLKERYPGQIAEVRTAVIWYKASSIVVPDYYVEYLRNNPWIHQPFEVYEQVSLAELAGRDLARLSG